MVSNTGLLGVTEDMSQLASLSRSIPTCATNTSSGTGNNGSLRSQTITMPTLSLTQTYSYDHLNRLAQAQETGGAGWTQGYGYDVLGNRWVASNSGLPALNLQTPTSSSWYSTTVPNQYAASTGWVYDFAGNVLQVGQMARSFSYDAENRQVTACLNCGQGAPTGSYQYDGLGQRVSKTVAGTPAVTTTYVYDAFGNLAAEYSTGPEPSACGTATCYVTADHLGSTRMLTPSPVSTSVVRYDYQPFGQEILAGTYGDGRTTAMGYLGAADATNPKFTGQSRDRETADPSSDPSAQTGTDNFLARYYDPLQGRFTSPDPGNAGADPANPQSWNGNAYVANNPLSYTDPSGEFMLATEAGATTGNPIAIGIGAAIDLGSLLYGILGGGPSTIPPSLATPSSPILTPDDGLDVDDLGAFADDFTARQAAANGADYIAGVIDNFSFGLTGLLRRSLPGGDPRNHCSSYYRAGQWSEVGAEIGLTFGSATLETLAKGAARNAVRNAARQEIRRAGVKAAEGQVLHHRLPLFGHPGGGGTVFPTGGLPASVHSAPWNLESLSPAAHLEAHRTLRAAESVGTAVINPPLTGVRTVSAAAGCRE